MDTLMFETFNASTTDSILLARRFHKNYVIPVLGEDILF